MKGKITGTAGAALFFSTFAALTFCIGCGGIEGTYADVSHSFILELKSGSKATFTAMGDPADCAWDSSAKKLTVNCKGEAGKIVFTVMDDGSLTAPGTFIPTLVKQK